MSSRLNLLKIKKIRLSVTDTGPGMSKVEQDMIFEKFERLNADKECIPGMGIGLALTKRLVEIMGGTISVASKTNTGTTFSVDFNKV